MNWEELKLTRKGIFNHPLAEQVVNEAWGVFLKNNSENFDEFALWLTTQKNWAVFIERFEKTSGLELGANYKRSPAIPPEATTNATPPKGQAVNQLPWNRPSPKWAPTNIFHMVTESTFADVTARGYDILSNVIGLPIFASQLGMQQLNAAHYAVFIVGAIAISFIEVLALRALSQAIAIHRQPPSQDGYIRAVHKFAVFIYGAFFVIGMFLWAVDLYLSILPWVQLFNGTAIGWLMGLVLSMLVEYVEIDAHIKTLKTLEADVSPAK